MAEFIERLWTSPDSLRLYARDYPGDGDAGTPVVCLHGLTRNSRDFEALAPFIAATGRRVLAMDMRGRGRSDYDPNPTHYTIPVYASDVLGFLTNLGIARAAFVGTSMGGLIALSVGALAPERVGATLLNDVGPEVAPAGLARILSGLGLKGVVGWDEARAYAKTANAAAFPHYLDGDWDVFTRRLFRPADGGWRLDYDPAIAAPLKAAPEGPPPDLWPLFEAIAKDRTLGLVRGATSDVLAAETAARMRAAAPHMIYAEIEGVGHAPTLAEPGAEAAIRAWLAADA